MGKKLSSIKLLLWIGIVLFFLWFLIFCFAPEKILAALSMTETKGFFLRVFGIFPLGWAILFFFALKDIEKNMAIINGAIITGVLATISIVVYGFIESAGGWFHWLSAVVLLALNVLLFLFKPKPKAA